MQIIFDMVSGTCIVEFRGAIKTLGPFKNQREPMKQVKITAADKDGPGRPPGSSKAIMKG